MSHAHPRPRPTRIAWFEGSRLSHRDLADAVEHEARMLELHVRAVHDTWGIAFGLETTIAADKLSVTVQPGLAYGCGGESLLVIVPTTIGVPLPSEASSVFDLVLLPALVPSGCEQQPVDCNRERIPLRTRLDWRAADVTSCSCNDDALAIGRFVRVGGTLTASTDFVRKRVRGLVRPRVASGVTRPGALTWNDGTGDLVAQVDTSAGGFTTTPVYFLTLAAPTTLANSTFLPFIAVGQGTPTRFTVHLSIAAKPPAFAPIFAMMDEIKMLTFAWTGVESVIGCSPVLPPYAKLAPFLPSGAFK
jgi:hypothetical protein